LVAFFLEALFDESGDFAVVLYNENLHDGNLSQAI